MVATAAAEPITFSSPSRELRVRTSAMAEDRPLIYLNNAATSWPKPPEVLAAVFESLSLPVFGSGRTTVSQGEDYVTKARDALSGLFGVETAEHVVFTQNATDSLNVKEVREAEGPARDEMAVRWEYYAALPAVTAGASIVCVRHPLTVKPLKAAIAALWGGQGGAR